jgi:iron complex outermembrane receptor protein
LRIFIFIFFVSFLYGNSFSELLSEYKSKSDLSNNTKIENSGQVIVFTRKDIESMQARSLKDILKTLPLAYYNESRYGISDIMYKGMNLPFNSNNFRIYIDNQEITTASFGSGIAFMADIELDFVDHIEVYLVNPEKTKFC